MPFGIVGRTGPGMRQVVGFGDRSTGRGTFWGAPLSTGTYRLYVCYSAATWTSCQITCYPTPQKKPRCRWETAWHGRASWSLISCYTIRLGWTDGRCWPISLQQRTSSTVADEHKFAVVVCLSQKLVHWYKFTDFTLPHLYLVLPLGMIWLELFHGDFWHQKTIRVPGLLYDVLSVILGLAVFVQLWLVMDGWTHDDS